MADSARRTGPALEAHQRFLLWLVPTVEGFPRSQKFLLGDRLQATALDVLEALIEATYTRDRRGQLARANQSPLAWPHGARRVECILYRQPSNAWRVAHPIQAARSRSASLEAAVGSGSPYGRVI